MSLLDPHNLPFAAALCLLAVLAAMQVVGIADMIGDSEVDHDTGGAMDGLLSLLGVGRVPFMIWLALLLVVFAALGLSIQALAASLTGGPLAAALAALFAGGAALPLTALLARPLGAILPQDETSAVTLDALLGRRGHVTDGVARRGSPARARVRDLHGTTHHVMIEPHEDADEFHSGDEVLLVRREGEAFFATPLSVRALSPH